MGELVQQCERCGKELPEQTGRGRRRRLCPGGCARHCERCGKEMPRTPGRPRKTCAEPCEPKPVATVENSPQIRHSNPYNLGSNSPGMPEIVPITPVLRPKTPHSGSETASDADLALIESFQGRLVSAGRLETPQGQLVMRLVDLLVHGHHTSSGAATLSKEVRAAMDEALKGAPLPADALDELANRRRQKAAGA